MDKCGGAREVQEWPQNPDYLVRSPVLPAFVERHRDELAGLGYDRRFYRMWRFFLLPPGPHRPAGISSGRSCSARTASMVGTIQFARNSPITRPKRSR